MKILAIYPYPVEPDGLSLQGHYLVKGLKELGHEVMSCGREKSLQKIWAYESFKPDAVIGIGYWADAPDLIIEPMKYGLKAVPWFNADGWIANYQELLNELPLIFATSNWVKSTYIRDGVKGDNIHVAHIGFDPEVFYPHEKNDLSISAVRKLLGVKEDEKMILTVGGDVTSKGAQEMLGALAKIDKDFKKWKYICKVNDGFSSRDHGREEKNLIKELGIDKKKVIYLKGCYPPEFVAKILNACDIYAAPSRLEGFGMIQLEAQACGKPVVSINVGGPKDTIVHEKTGFLVDIEQEIKLEREWAYKWMGFQEKHQIEFSEPKTFAYRANTEQLTEHTLKLLTDDNLREEMGRAAAQHALENFHYRNLAAEMIKLIEEKVILKNNNIYKLNE